MAGGVFKRCTKCGNTVAQRRCASCGSTSFGWAFRTYVGKDANGRWMRQLRSGFPTKREAERALSELRAAIDQGGYVEASNLTVRDYLLGEWLPATTPPRVGYETWLDRKRNLKTHVVPRIGAVRLQDLNAGHLNRLYAELLRGGRVDGSGGLSPTSVRRIHAMLRKALNDALRWGLVRRNAATTADAPPAKVVAAARRRGMTTWNKEELRRFVRATRSHDLGPLWLFAATTGMRRSELTGLCWSDLDLDARTVTVRHTVVPSAHGYRLVESQKSTLSARTIHLDRRVVAMLQRHRTLQDQARRDAGPGWHDHGVVFPREDGSWWNPPAISLAFRRAVRVAGLRPIRLHDLRHTHATLLLGIPGVNPKVVSERLGHSSVAFTLETYAHVMPGMQPEAAALFMDLVDGFDTEDADKPPDAEVDGYGGDGPAEDTEDS